LSEHCDSAYRVKVGRVDLILGPGMSSFLGNFLPV
jgi:hypothetical protein